MTNPERSDERNMPRPAGLPFLGNAFDLAGDIRAYLTQKYLELGPVFEVSAPGRRLIVLAGVEANEFFVRHGSDHFRSHETWHKFNQGFGAEDAMISVDGTDHFRLRRAQRRGYSRQQGEEHISDMVSIAKRAIDTWPTNVPIPGLKAVRHIATDQLGTIVSGYSPREYLDDIATYVQTLLMTRVTRQRPAIWLYSPKVWRARQKVEELHSNVLAAHSPEARQNQPRDLVDDLLELHEADPQLLPEADLKLAMLGPYIAGLDTVSNTVAFMIYALLKNPDVMDLVIDEADRMFREGQPTADDVKSMDVMHRAALETLRMYPIAPALTRTVTKSFNFAGYEIPAGTEVLIGTTVTHYLPDLFPEPERFDIDRYLPPRNEHRQIAYAPFGLGTHRCLGAQFAEFQIAVTVATILHHVNLELAPPNYNLKIDPKPTPSPDKNFKFHTSPRR